MMDFDFLDCISFYEGELDVDLIFVIFEVIKIGKFIFLFKIEFKCRI